MSTPSQISPQKYPKIVLQTYLIIEFSSLLLASLTIFSLKTIWLQGPFQPFVRFIDTFILLWLGISFCCGLFIAIIETWRNIAEKEYTFLLLPIAPFYIQSVLFFLIELIGNPPLK